ncbi:hypothetical protein J3Q64DRAFT_1701592 [Phycomyces blakesleeanus]|uniref:Uncharacterized protein n=1 Tax=Phycomyces blakesleeanus TaxID=4837 RepID=A0ABR3ARB6_PHYBL
MSMSLLVSLSISLFTMQLDQLCSEKAIYTLTHIPALFPMYKNKKIDFHFDLFSLLTGIGKTVNELQSLDVIGSLADMRTTVSKSSLETVLPISTWVLSLQGPH